MHRNLTIPMVAASACALVAVIVAGCSSPSTTGTNSNGTTNRVGVMPGNRAPTSGSTASAGESIYLAGVGSDGQSISHTAPRVSQGALMMGGGGCGSCHGRDGRGGTIRMMMGAEIKAPDITYGALIKAGFTDATIRKAITDGLDESGKPLKDAMPRWRMNAGDQDAIIAYLKQLGQ